MLKFAIFGRKNTSDPPVLGPPGLMAGAGEVPSHHERWLGHALFDLQRKHMAEDGGVHVESLLGSLAALGGFACALAAVHDASFRQSVSGREMRPVEAADGHRYLPADRVRRYLTDGSRPLLTLPLTTAVNDGAEMPPYRLAALLQRISASCGTPEFGLPQLSGEHCPAELPLTYVRAGWHRMQDKLDEHGIKADDYPVVFSHALRRAMESIRLALDPTPAAILTIEYAAPMAYLDPDRVFRAPSG